MCRYGGAEIPSVAAFIGQFNSFPFHATIITTKATFHACMNVWRVKVVIIIFALFSTGGCVAQEAIKIITGQYIPLNNTFIYNAVDCSSSTFKLPIS